MRTNKRAFKNISLYTCLVFLSFSLIALKGKEDIRYVHSLEDFRTHTTSHIHNVYRLGMYLYQKHRDTLFSDVPVHILREKLLIHDFEKLDSLDHLRNLGYQNRLTFLERLYANFGKQKNSEMDLLIHELNKYASHNDIEVLRKHNLINANGTLSSLAQKIILIERIADLVERQKNPISKEEFGRAKMRPAHEFLTTPLEKRLAQELVRVYSEITPANPLIHRVSKTKSAPLCSQIFL